MRKGPGDIFRNLNPKLGNVAVSKDTVINQVPPPEQEIKQDKSKFAIKLNNN